MSLRRAVSVRYLAPVLMLLAPLRAEAAGLSAEEVAARRQLIEQAQSSRAAGDFARALELATRAGELEMSVSLRRFLAEVQFEVGESAAALGSAELCERDARTVGAVDHQAACADIAAKAREQVGFVIVRVSPDAEDTRVEVSGGELPRLLWGQRYVVKPGSVTAKATGGRYEDATATVEVARGDVVEISLTLIPKPTNVSTPAEQPTYELSPLVPIGAGVAVVGFAVALGLGLSGVTALADYEDRCTSAGAPGSCEAEQSSLQDDLDLRAIGVNVSLGTATVGLVVGAIGLFLSGTPDPSEAALWQGKVLF